MLFFPLQYWLFLAPGILFMLWAQARTRAAYRKYGQVGSASGLTGAQAARRLLDAHGLRDVGIEPVAGQLTDHYDPRQAVLRLSAGVHDSPSLAAIGVACHEAGHALQHAEGYRPLMTRQAFLPLAAFASRAWPWLFLASMFLGMGGGLLGRSLVLGAVACLLAYAFFALVTLPVEFDASRRALLLMESSRTLTVEEVAGARKVLSAAALTYVASAAQALLMVIYMLTRLGRR